MLDVCLLHFDPSLPIIVSADSSKYGLGAVLCQLKDGVELPVAKLQPDSERGISPTLCIKKISPLLVGNEIQFDY